MKISANLISMLSYGEGHTIFKAWAVLRVLCENGIDAKISSSEEQIIIKNDNSTIKIPLIRPPNKLAQPYDKYSIVDWNFTDKSYGVHDLELIRALCNYCKIDTSGNIFSGRGYQYRYYHEQFNNFLSKVGDNGR